MARAFPFWGVCLIVLLPGVQPIRGETYPLIIKGKVMMRDGSPPPVTVALERICSDRNGDRPGPLTDKKGEYVWRMDVDPMRTRSCRIQATHAGYVSTSIDISALNGYLSTTVTLDPIIITYQAADPYAIIASINQIPSRAKSLWRAAMKAIDAGDYREARLQLEETMRVAPKFALGWHALGVVSDFQSMFKEARDAYENAIKFNSKLLPAYVTLLRLCIKTKDWDSAIKTADALIKADKKRLWPEAHLHRAVALYELKDLESASISAQEAIRLDPNRTNPRAEYVLGRILVAKGDLAGAREHISKYLELDEKAPDAERIRMYLQNLDKPQAQPAEGEELELEYL
jgi:tetratricopeptide (TPR) repeat protein